jgi:hypothetical protein
MPLANAGVQRRFSEKWVGAEENGECEYGVFFERAGLATKISENYTMQQQGIKND